MIFSKKDVACSLGDAVIFAIGNNEEPVFSYNKWNQLLINSMNFSNHGFVSFEGMTQDETGYLCYYKDTASSIWVKFTVNNRERVISILKEYDYSEEEVTIVENFLNQIEDEDGSIFLHVGCGSYNF
jgi:hypothetical protein